MFEQFEEVAGVLIAILPSAISVLTVVAAVAISHAKIATAFRQFSDAMKSRDKDVSEAKKEMAAMQEEILQLKEQATELYNDLGLSLSSAINMFLRQSVRENGLPFKPQRTRRKSELELASEEADQLMNDPNAKTYNNFQEILDELGIDA